jgi:hypothetical protein
MEGETFWWLNGQSSYGFVPGKPTVTRNPKIAEFLENKLGFTSCISDKDAQMLSDCGIKV